MIDAETLNAVPHLESPEIHARYRDLLREWLPESGLVLKTDAYNEASGGFRHLGDCGLEGRTIYIEYDQQTIATARRKHPGKAIVQGDIRDLRFPDGLFAAVADLSTIDHVKPLDMQWAIREYYRCLRSDGVLILVVWCKPAERLTISGAAWDASEQYYWPGDPRSLLVPRFSCEYAEWICHRGDAYLAEMVARPREGW